MTTQRWERDFTGVPDGFWKQQLPTKYLKLAARGDVESLQSLLAEHPDWLNKRANHNRTLLWKATRSGKLAAVQWLVALGADLHATGSYNNESYVQITPYCAAVYYRRPALVEYFRSLGAHQQLDVFRATFLGEWAQVAHHLEQNPALLNAEDPQDNIYYVPLVAFAIMGNQFAVLEALLERGAPVAPYSAQLIYLATRVGRLDILKRLIKGGIEVAATTGAAFVGASDLTLVRYLLEQGAPPNTVDENEVSLLHYLVRGDKGEQPAKVQLLLQYGANVHARDKQGRTPLHLAAQAGYAEVVALLLAHGSDRQCQDKNGATPLDLAMRAGKNKVVDLLE